MFDRVRTGGSGRAPKPGPAEQAERLGESRSRHNDSRRAPVRILSCCGACTSYDRALRRNAAPSASLRRTAIEIVILPGDAIGPEISAVTRTVLESIDAKHSLGLVLTEYPIGFTSLATQGTSLPPATLEAVRAADGVILAPV